MTTKNTNEKKSSHDLEYSVSDFNFNKEVSDVFDEHVRKSIPFYDDIQRSISLISDHFLSNGTFAYDLGCSLGETLISLHKRHPGKNITYCGVDDSKSMIDLATENTSHIDNLELIQTSIENFKFANPADFIVLNLVLHFIKKEKRELIVQNIYDNLNKGGALILVEKCYSSDGQIQNIFDNSFHDLKELEGLTHEEIRKKEQAIRGVLMPLKLNENLKILQDVGFETDIFYKFYNFAGIIAIKKYT